jgi:hypothetical protein
LIFVVKQSVPVFGLFNPEDEGTTIPWNTGTSCPMTLCHFTEDFNHRLYCGFLSHHMWADAQRHGTRTATVQVSAVSTQNCLSSSLLCIRFKLVTKQKQALKCHVFHVYICYIMSFSTKAVAACLLAKLELESRLESYGFWHHKFCMFGSVFHRDLLPHPLGWSDRININLDAVTKNPKMEAKCSLKHQLPV